MFSMSALKSKVKHMVGTPTAVLLEDTSDVSSGWSSKDTCKFERERECVGRKNLCIMVGTWNVAGRLPPSNLDLDKWLDVDHCPDIYVLGFQEIVPLNASNILGVEDGRPSQVWKAMISKTINEKTLNKSSKVLRGSQLFRSVTRSTSNDSLKPTQIDYKNSKDSRGKEAMTSSGSKEMEAHDLDGNNDFVHDQRATCSKECDLGEIDYYNNISQWFPLETSTLNSSSNTFIDHTYGIIKSLSWMRKSRYLQVVSEQMGGIHISVWIHRKLKNHIKNIMVSHVGTGVLGYLGNKGAISVSMNVCGCSYCYVCSHLSSGEKKADINHRYVDVIDILKRTHFVTKPPCNILFSRTRNNDSSSKIPKLILEHDSIIWLGDLNYRINNMSNDDIQFLVTQEEWDPLLEKDQLKREFCKGKAFEGWKEGSINFAPTYKYEFDTNINNFGDSRNKHRKPAWCDRIIWHGEKLRLLSYTRVESSLSDHKPVKASFLANTY